MLLERLPGYSPKERTLEGYEHDEKRAKTACLGMAEFEYAFRTWLLEQYHQQPHGQVEGTPQERWEQGNFVPNVPESLAQLDLLLLTTPKERRVQQEGISFEGYRYVHTTLAAYVGELVVIRYDPADMAEIRVYYHQRFLCRAICPELSGSVVSRAEILAARKERRVWERGQLRKRRAIVRRFQIKRPVELCGFEDESEDDGEAFRGRGAQQSYNGLKRYEHEGTRD